MPIHNYSNFLIYLNEFPKCIFKQEINVSCLENLIPNKYFKLCYKLCLQLECFSQLKRLKLILGNVRELLVNETLTIRMYVYIVSPCSRGANSTQCIRSIRDRDIIVAIFDDLFH